MSPFGAFAHRMFSLFVSSSSSSSFLTPPLSSSSSSSPSDSFFFIRTAANNLVVYIGVVSYSRVATVFTVIASSKGPFLTRNVKALAPFQIAQSLARMNLFSFGDVEEKRKQREAKKCKWKRRLSSPPPFSFIHLPPSFSLLHHSSPPLGGQAKLTCDEPGKHEEFRCNYPTYPGANDPYNNFEVFEEMMSVFYFLLPPRLFLLSFPPPSSSSFSPSLPLSFS